MNPVLINVIAIILIILVVGGAVFYIVKNRKKGVKCIGCASASKCNCGCSKKGESQKEDNI